MAIGIWDPGPRYEHSDRIRIQLKGPDPKEPIDFIFADSAESTLTFSKYSLKLVHLKVYLRTIYAKTISVLLIETILV